MEFQFARVMRFHVEKKFGFADILAGDADSGSTGQTLFFHHNTARFTVVREGQVCFGGKTRRTEHGTELRQGYPEKDDVIAFTPAARSKGKNTEASAWCAAGVYEESLGRLSKLRSRTPRKGNPRARQAPRPAEQQPPTIFHDRPEVATFDKWQIVSLANDDQVGLLQGFASGYPRYFTRAQLETASAESLGFYAENLADRRGRYGIEQFVLQGGNGWTDWVNIRTIEPLQGEVPEPDWGNCNTCKCDLTESENAIGFLCDDCRAKAHAELDSQSW